MKISYSAPAKVILSGEHAVVYGKPSLITALDMRIRVTIEEGRADIDQNVLTVDGHVRHYLRSRHIEHNERTFTASIESAIPVGRNLGSSAALAVATTAALLHFYTGREHDKSEINSVAYLSEKTFHGNPSGADNSTSCLGGLIYYRREFEFLKNISALNAKLPNIIVDRLVLIDSGRATESTADMVARVAQYYNSHAQDADHIMNAIEKLTKRMVVSIMAEDTEMFSQCIVENEQELERLGVISDSAKSLLQSLSEYGVGKVTGGGGHSTGSGYMLFCARDYEGTIRYLDDKNIPYLKFAQDFEGVRREDLS